MDPLCWRSVLTPLCFCFRGMLTHAVHPPTTEHVYAQWQEREEARPPLVALQDVRREGACRPPFGVLQTLQVKQEEVASPLSSDSPSRTHGKNSKAFRLKFKGNGVAPVGRSARRLFSGLGLEQFPLREDSRRVVFVHTGKRGRLSKADLDTGWSKEDERQCSLCQKYGDAKPNVSFQTSFDML